MHSNLSKGAQQDNGIDCGVFALVAALYLTADRTFPNRIDAHSWRIIFRAALDASFSVSDDQVLELPPFPGSSGMSDTSVNEITEIRRREPSDEDLRKRVKSSSHALNHLKTKVWGISEILSTLEIIQQQRNELHKYAVQEHSIVAAECERFTQLLESISSLGFARYGAAVAEGLAKTPRGLQVRA